MNNSHSTPPLNPSQQPNNDEIDLGEMFFVLWKGKWKIIISVLVFFIGSLIYSFATQELWTSKITVGLQHEENIKTYTHQVRKFKPLFYVQKDNDFILENEEFEKHLGSNFIFTRFIDLFNAQEVKRRFLTSNEYQKIKKQLEPVMEKELTNQWIETLSASPQSNIHSPHRLSLQSINSESSYQLMKGYMTFVAQETPRYVYADLLGILASHQNNLEQQRSMLEANAKNKVELEIVRAQYELEIARVAGVVNPIPLSRHNQLFNIDLGSKGIEAKIATLKSIKNFALIDPNLLQIETKLSLLDSLKVDTSIQFKPFSFVGNSEPTVSMDKPRKAMIVILGTIFGGVVGVILVLVSVFFRKKI